MRDQAVLEFEHWELFLFFSKSFFEYTQTRQMSVELLQIGIPSSSFLFYITSLFSVCISPV